MTKRQRAIVSVIFELLCVLFACKWIGIIEVKAEYGNEIDSYKIFLWDLIEDTDEFGENYVRVLKWDRNGDGKYDVGDDAVYYYYFAIEDFDSDGMVELLLQSGQRDPETGQERGRAFYFYKYNETEKSVELSSWGALESTPLDDVIFYSNGIVQSGENHFIPVGKNVYTDLGVFPIVSKYEDVDEIDAGRAICLRENDNNYEMLLLGPNTVEEVIALSEEEYQTRLDVLTSGEVLDVDLKEFSEENVITFCQQEQVEKKDIVATIKTKNGDVDVTIREDMFQSDSSEYNKEIAVLAAVLSEAAYDESFGDKEGKYISAAYESLGFPKENISLYSYPKNPYNEENFTTGDGSFAMSIASRYIEDEMLLVVGFRGSYSLMDWVADVYSGLRSSDKSFAGTKVWAGFYDFWNSYKIFMKSYYDAHEELRKADQEGKLKVLVTGHSLGGAAANLTGKSLNNGDSVFQSVKNEDVYVYTFAAPRVCKKNSGDDSNIFNIINTADMVPVMPSFFARYGKYCPFEYESDNILENHGCKHYVDAVIEDKVSEAQKEPENGITKDYRSLFRLLRILCPVDVEIRKDGDVVCRIENEEVVVCSDEIGCLVENGHKLISLPENTSYSVRITGNENGSMNYSLQTIDRKEESEQSYYDVSFEKGEVFTAEIPALDRGETPELYRGDGTEREKILQDKAEKPLVEEGGEGEINTDTDVASMDTSMENQSEQKRNDIRKMIMVVLIIAGAALFFGGMGIYLYRKKNGGK